MSNPYRYIAAEHALIQPSMEKPIPDMLDVSTGWIAKVKEYQSHLASLPRLAVDPKAKVDWKDGEQLEENIDWRKFECDQCDGCGWYEGGKTLQTTCETCRGNGFIVQPLAKVDKWEERAKKFDDKLPELAKALRSSNLQNSCADIDTYDGWIRCKTDLPKKGEEVLVTNGKDVWMGSICHTERRGAMPFKEWSLVYDGSPPFSSTEVIAWMFKPYVPPELTDHNSPAIPIKPVQQKTSISYQHRGAVEATIFSFMGRFAIEDSPEILKEAVDYCMSLRPYPNRGVQEEESQDYDTGLHAKLYPCANKKLEYIICAAIHFKNDTKYQHQPKNVETGFVVCGRRHHNCFYIAATCIADGYSEMKGSAVQGFLTSKDRFVTREEAGVIAFEQKQTDRKTNCLFSEDLY